MAAATNVAGSTTLPDVFRHIDVVETRRATQGHTVYQVCLSVTNVDSGDLLVEVSLWQRYSAFVQLHKQLEELYWSLDSAKQKGNFPDFPKPSFFGRFDESEIDERRQRARQLLQFIITVPQLLCSQALASFFLHSGEVNKSSWASVITGVFTEGPALASEEGRFQPAVTLQGMNSEHQVSITPTDGLSEVSTEASTGMSNSSDSTVGTISDDRTTLSTPVLPSQSTGDSVPNITAEEDEKSLLPSDPVVAADEDIDNPTGDVQRVCVGSPSAHRGQSVGDASIWEFKCISPVMDTLDANNDDVDEAADTPVSGSTVLDDGTAIGKEQEADTEEECSTGPGSPPSVVLTDLSMIDHQLEKAYDCEGQAGSAVGMMSGSTTPLSTSEPQTPSGRNSPGLCLSPGQPVACVYSPPDTTHGAWFKDAVAASWDDIEQQLKSECSDPISSSSPCAAETTASQSETTRTDASSPASNDRMQPVAASEGCLSPDTPNGTPNGPRPVRAPSVDSISRIELSGDGDYVLQSATVIGQALEAEAGSDFALAFSLYKTGVGLLLSGVQTDTNATRRDAVRRKTAQYLERAETLHHRHLKSASDVKDGRWQDTPRHVPAPTAAPVAQEPHTTSLQLRDFSVMRPLGKLILARNRHTQDVYVIKTLNKTSSPQQQQLSTSRKGRRSRTRNLMSTLCPYMVRPIGHFDTTSRLFLLVEYAQRGSLWSSLDKFQEEITLDAVSGEPAKQDSQTSTSSSGSALPGLSSPPPLPSEHKFPRCITAVPESRVRRWAAQVVSALSHLHNHDFIWKDLQPKNLLLDHQDNILLTYDGHWENVARQQSLWAREHLYSAPELTGVEKPTTAADWWSLGAILYVLLTGRTLRSCHPAGVSSHSCLRLPPHLSFQASSLLQNLLQPSCKERLGAGHSGVEEIRSHPFFAGVQWTTSH